MISKGLRTGILLCGLLLLESPAYANCFEFKTLGTNDAGTFFLGCESQFSGLSYAVNEVIREDSRHSFVKLVTRNKGYMCFIEDGDSECKQQPFGPFLLGVYKSNSGTELELTSFDSYKSWYAKQAMKRFPRSVGGAESTGCFLVQSSDERFVLGLDSNRLPETRSCIIRLEEWK